MHLGNNVHEYRTASCSVRVYMPHTRACRDLVSKRYPRNFDLRADGDILEQSLVFYPERDGRTNHRRGGAIMSFIKFRTESRQEGIAFREEKRGPRSEIFIKDGYIVGTKSRCFENPACPLAPSSLLLRGRWTRNPNGLFGIFTQKYNRPVLPPEKDREHFRTLVGDASDKRATVFKGMREF